jgi:hypothetical protein
MRAPQVADFYSAHWPDFTPPLTVMWQLHHVYGAEIAAGAPPVRNLYDQLSTEFARRREIGEIPDQPKGEAVSSGYKRRKSRKRW